MNITKIIEEPSITEKTMLFQLALEVDAWEGKFLIDRDDASRLRFAEAVVTLNSYRKQHGL